MSLIGKNTVFRFIAKYPKQTTGTLYKRTGGDTFAAGVAYAHIYFPPNMNETGITNNGTPSRSGDVLMFQAGESIAPEPDDKLTDADGNTWIVYTVKTSLNFQAGYAVHRVGLMQIQAA